MEKLLDIIIPAYNAHSTLQQTLASIAIQYRKEDIKVTIVNDCSDKGYEDLVSPYSSLFDIEIINLEKNVGCGMARQIGIEKTSAPYITFIDSDDMLFNAFSIQILLETVLNNEEINIAYGQILEYQAATDYENLISSKHFTWIFGSIFKRQFIEDNHIHFPDNSNGEDSCFNKVCKMLCNTNEIVYIDRPIYLWTDLNKNGRINTDQFKVIDAKIGYLNNTILAYQMLKEIGFVMDKIDGKYEILSSLFSIYSQYTQLINNIGLYSEQLKEISFSSKMREYMDLVYKLYNEYYLEYKEDVTSYDLLLVWNINKDKFRDRLEFNASVEDFTTFLERLDRKEI